jgi:hypothetical protein
MVFLEWNVEKEMNVLLDFRKCSEIKIKIIFDKGNFSMDKLP